MFELHKPRAVDNERLRFDWMPRARESVFRSGDPEDAILMKWDPKNFVCGQARQYF